MHPITLIGGEIAFVDDADAEAVGAYRWRAQYGYAREGVRDKIAAVVTGSASMGRLKSLHRMLLAPEAGQVVDHIDGNPLNNTRSNLRACLHGDNMANRAMHRNNAAGVKGVYRDRRYAETKWRACIKRGGRTIHLGTYSDIESASQAYLDAAARLHGEFARAA